MLLLTATRETQGNRVRDEFTRCITGELVRPNVCPRYDECAYCDRLFAGITSGGVTTTGMLADVDVTLDQLADVVRGYCLPDVEDEDVDGLVEDLLWPARQPELTLGVVVTRTLDGRLTVCS